VPHTTRQLQVPDLDFTWSLPGVPGCYLDFTWSPPGRMGECKVLIMIDDWYEWAMRLDRQWHQAWAKEQYYGNWNSSSTTSGAERSSQRTTSGPSNNPVTMQRSQWRMPGPRPEQGNWHQSGGQFTGQSNPGPRPLPPGVPMDVDQTQRRPFTCYKCGKLGHMARNCTTRIDLRQVRSMDIDALTEYIRSMNMQNQSATEESSKDDGNQDLLA
jgi:hypothetical protein